jgi:uncharacterized membrane protein YczE
MDSRWRPTPTRFARLVFGLTVFGIGEAFLIASELGNSPWTVLAEGLGDQIGVAVGTATIIVSVAVIALWLPLRQPPGLGTICNALGIGLAIDATLALLPEPLPLAVRIAMIPAGIAIVGLGSGFYLTSRLGPGPRDGLMTGLHRRTGVSLRLARAGIETSVVVAGYFLGGTVGVGTVAFALLIGPTVQAFVHAMGERDTASL